MKLPFAKNISQSALLLAMGISSGLPFSITGTTLQAWAVEKGVNLSEVGLYSLLGLPYALKFLWAPFLDRLKFPQLGRRCGVILWSQIFLIILLCALSFCDPSRESSLLLSVALMISLLSASQDVAVDAYRAESLRARELGRGAALGSLGYRIGMLISGAGALVLADYVGFEATMVIQAAILLPFLFAPILAPQIQGVETNPSDDVNSNPVISKAGYLAEPFQDLLKRKNIFVIFLVTVLYRAGDMFVSAMAVPFLMTIGFSTGIVGTMQKGFGVSSLLLGALFAGYLMKRMPLRSSLVLFGILQAVSTATYLLLVQDHSFATLATVIFIENFCSGLGTAAFLAYLMRETRGRFTGTQYALLTSLMALTRIGLGSGSGFAADNFGWTAFFLIATAIGGLGVVAALFVEVTSERELEPEIPDIVTR